MDYDVHIIDGGLDLSWDMRWPIVEDRDYTSSAIEAYIAGIPRR